MRTSFFLKSLVLACAVVIGRRDGDHGRRDSGRPRDLGVVFSYQQNRTALGSRSRSQPGAAVVTVTDAYCRAIASTF